MIYDFRVNEEPTIYPTSRCSVGGNRSHGSCRPGGKHRYYWRTGSRHATNRTQYETKRVRAWSHWLASRFRNRRSQCRQGRGELPLLLPRNAADGITIATRGVSLTIDVCLVSDHPASILGWTSSIAPPEAFSKITISIALGTGVVTRPEKVESVDLGLDFCNFPYRRCLKFTCCRFSNIKSLVFICKNRKLYNFSNLWYNLNKFNFKERKC